MQPVLWPRRLPAGTCQADRATHAFVRVNDENFDLRSRLRFPSSRIDYGM
jgi:hypothetical protein